MTRALRVAAPDPDPTNWSADEWWRSPDRDEDNDE